MTLLGALVFGSVTAALSDSRPSTVTLDPQQFDRLVESVAKALTVDPSGRNQAAETSGLIKSSPPLIERQTDREAEGTSFGDKATAVLSAYPALWSFLSTIPVLLDESNDGKRLSVHLALLVTAALLAWAVETIIRGLTRPVWRRWGSGVVGGALIRRILLMALLDGVALSAVWLGSYGAFRTLHDGIDPQARLAALVLANFFFWRLYLFACRLVLRPDTSSTRIAEMDDADASSVYRRIAVTSAVVLTARTAIQFLVDRGVPQVSIGAATLVNDVLAIAVFTWAAVGARKPVANWLGRLVASEKGPGLAGAVARHWLWVAIPFVYLLVAANAYGSISAYPAVAQTLLMTLNIVMGILGFETAIDFGRRTLVSVDRQRVTSTGLRAYDIAARCLRVAVVVIAGVVVVEAWAVNVVGLVAPDQWPALSRSGIRIGMTIFVADAAWQGIRFFASRSVGVQTPGAGGSLPLGSEATATRFATLVPLLRVALGGALGAVAFLTMLSEVGVNIAPLLAGASVFGLAISFGSQTLVKDIVSGVFFLADDAFRVGEYVDCGKAKGTVEGFTVRSIRLRHQDGPLHTLPFGQLGQITNFSRGWSVIKFNLRFAATTNLETLRKRVKQIGIEMAADEDLGPEIMVPLKMMGVVEIADNALVVRFKIMVRPVNPGLVQRAAMARMVQALPAAGIEFARTVPVQGPATATSAAVVSTSTQAPASATVSP